MIGLARRFAALLAAALVLAHPVSAQEGPTGFAPGSVCHAAVTSSADYAELARHPAAWDCSTAEWKSTGRVALRFDLRDRLPDAAPPDHLQFTRVHFERMQITAIAADGTTATRSLARDEVLPGRFLLEAAVALPSMEEPPIAVVIMVEGAPSAGRLLSARAVAGAPVELLAGADHLWAALLCGLLLAPMFFDLGFYRTLRAHFPLFHAAFCILACVQTAAYSGLLLLLGDFSMVTMRVISILSFDLMVAATSLFILSFVEEGIFANVHRRLLLGMAGLTVVLGLIAAFALPLLGPATGTIYYGGYVIYLAALAVVLVRALRMGSRAIRFVILAHLPLLIIGMTNVVEGLFAPAGFVFDTYWPQNLALAFEVIVTSFAVADRFLILKHERDRARTQQLALEKLATHDALTGLLNRRAIDEQFGDLHRAGYDTFALVDLDNFKSVNDRRGHKVGDDVLRAVARALQTDQEALAIRMGGEEFLLLLRGRNAAERAETLRQSIPIRVAREVEGLDRVVTASMGLLTFPHAALPNAGFSDVYARADQLLYEAKEQGRNRTVSERLKLFTPRRSTERRTAAA